MIHVFMLIPLGVPLGVPLGAHHVQYPTEFIYAGLLSPPGPKWTNYLTHPRVIHEGRLAVPGHFPRCTSARALVIQHAIHSLNHTWFAAGIAGGTTVETTHETQNCSRRAREQGARFTLNASTCTIVLGAHLDPSAPIANRALSRSSPHERKQYIERALRDNDCLFNDFTPFRV